MLLVEASLVQVCFTSFQLNSEFNLETRLHFDPVDGETLPSTGKSQALHPGERN